MALEDQTLHSYVGGWPEYLRVRAERNAKPVAAAPAASARPAVTGKSEAKRAAKRMNTAKRKPPAKDGNGAARLEAEIEAAEAALAAIEDELPSEPGAWASPSASARSTAKHEEPSGWSPSCTRTETVAG